MADATAITTDGLFPSATANASGESFDEVVLPHLDAAHRLARWLLRNEHDAEDVVQEALLRAWRYFQSFKGGNGRAWFLRIVRNTCGGSRGGRVHAATDPFDDERHSDSRPPANPEMLLLQSDAALLVAQAMGTLPDRFRKLLVLRELEGLSYRELADAMGIPMGTVMSSLSRARDALRDALLARLKPAQHGIVIQLQQVLETLHDNRASQNRARSIEARPGIIEREG